MTDIRTGVIGVGHLGYHHARLYKDLDGCTLAGVVDRDSDRARKVAEEFGVESFDSPQALLDAGVDAVSVAAPTSEHHDLAITLLAGGADVLVEKPISATIEEARAMVAAAADAGRLLQVGHVERFNGAVIALQESIKRPRFIECHRMSPYPNRGHDVSVVHDLMIHDIDVLFSLDNSEVESLDAIGVPVFSETEDIANVRLRLKSGCVANLTASRVSIDRMRKIRIFEENAYVSTDYSEQHVMVFRKKDGAIPEGDSPMNHIQIDPLDVRKEEPLRLELEAFLTSVRDRSRPVVNGEDGLRALELAEDIIAFARKHT